MAAFQDAIARARFVRKLAGDDPEVPVLEPQALALLSRYDERVQHFDWSKAVEEHPDQVRQVKPITEEKKLEGRLIRVGARQGARSNTG